MTTIGIEWSSPVPATALGNANSIPNGGGVYLWFYPKISVVTYVGETGNFKRRVDEHFATMLGYGGTIFDFAEDPRGYEFLRQNSDEDSLERSVAEGRVIYPWSQTEGTKRSFYAALDTGTLVEEMARKVWRYIGALRFMFGTIEQSSVPHAEIEGGIIEALRFKYHLGVWEGGRSNDIIIGRISRYPKGTYELRHEGNGADVVVGLLGKAMLHNVIPPGARG